MKEFVMKIFAYFRSVREYVFEKHTKAWIFSSGVLAALLSLGIMYRLRILYMINVDSAFTISEHPTLLFFKGLCNEALFSLIFTAFLFTILIPFNSMLSNRKIIRRIVFAKGMFLLLLMSFLYNTSYHFWVSMNTGFTRDLLLEALATTRMEEAARFLKPVDALFFIVPLAVYFLYMFGEKFVLWRNRGALLISGFVIVLYAGLSLIGSARLEGAIAQPPAHYTFLSFFEKDNWNTSETSVNAPRDATDQMKSMALIDPRFVNSNTRPSAAGLMGRPNEKWNVLYIIMESIGRQYVFDTSRGNPMPMPFFKELTQKGLFFDFHYSTGNTSPRSIFSMLSGLYPSPRVQMFCTKPDVMVPSLKTFLGESYDAFFVTPGSLDWFFPKGFLHNSGFKEIYGYKEIPARVVKDTYGKNDIDAVTFFIERLKKSKDRQFLAVYYSFAAHWPYVDYGEEFKIFKDTNSRLHRYFNNIRMLDGQIRRIFNFLEETKLADKTIVVIVSDHSEAFNQHPGVWVHSRDSYNENFSVPALLYQPRLFRPAKITYPTTHADIVPTLLDAMGIRYNEKLMQGESVLRGQPKRKYIFLFGNENTITTISMDKIKVQYSFKDKKCWAFNLNTDYAELKKLSCEQYADQKEAMMFYHSYQAKILEDYNSSIKSNMPFYGIRHYGRK